MSPMGKHVTVKLTEEDLAKAKADPRVAALDAEIAACWARFNELMPDDAAITHGQAKVASINNALQKYKDTKEVWDNEAELCDIQASSLKKKKMSAIKDQENTLRMTEHEDTVDESIQKLLYSPDNLPEPELEPLVLNASAIEKGGFGNGVLTEAAVQALKDPNLLQVFQKEQDRDEAWAQLLVESDDEPVGDPDRNGVEFQKGLPGFNDNCEMQVIDADMKETVISFMTALYHPVILNAIEEKIVVDAHNNQKPGLGEGAWISLKARKLATQFIQGMKLDDDKVAQINWWATLTEAKVEEMAKLCDEPEPSLSISAILKETLTPDTPCQVNKFVDSEEVDLAVAQKMGHIM
ncbi:hypothetical protein FRC06_008201 [Ceratobasidium sp. 370]|nr:hypothetical protein FRC06_008201 [Ceratobasidium sp. 370]